MTKTLVATPDPEPRHGQLVTMTVATGMANPATVQVSYVGAQGGFIQGLCPSCNQWVGFGHTCARL